MVGGYLLIGVPMFLIGCWLWSSAGAPTLEGVFGGGFWWYLPTPIVGMMLAYSAVDKVFQISDIENQAYVYNRVRSKASERREKGLD